MSSFETLDELHEYKNRAFEQVFGNVKYQRPENPFEENTWEALKFRARSHDVFRLDWSSYNSIKFADTFLPYVGGVEGKGLWMYDGAELFNNLRTVERKLFKFDNHKSLISLINYTYPKGALVGARKDKVQIREHEVLTFIELDEYDNIKVFFKFGSRFKGYLSSALKNSKQSISLNAIEDKVYQTDTKTFKAFFDSELVHYTMMRFILNTIGIEEQAVEFANYNKLYSKEVIAFMENYLIAEKYKVQVHIKKSQTEVYEAIDDTSNPNRIFPPPDTIYIWLVSKDSVNYDTSFIRVQLGDNVSKDFKQKEITLSYLENFVLDKIEKELLLNIYSKDTVGRETKRSLGDVFMRSKYIKDTTTDPVLKKVAETNPGLYVGVKAADLAAQKIENLKLGENRWNPRLKDFKPILQGDTKDNAMLCGIYNGLIQQAKAIPELAKLVFTFLGNDEEWEKFKDAIAQLLSDEELRRALFLAITKDYRDSIATGNVETLFYRMAYDAVAIVSILIGLYGLAKGVVSFVKFIRRAFLYIRRYGIESVTKLRGLKPKQIERILDDLDDQKPISIVFKTKKMKSKYLNEEVGINQPLGKESWNWPKKVRYLDEFERIKYKVKFKDGKVTDINGKILDTAKAGQLDGPVTGKAIFVMDEKGNIYLSMYSDRGFFHHSSLVAGEPVSAAGEIIIVEGVIIEISTKSGHYKPTLELNKQILNVLKNNKINTKKIKLTHETEY